MLVIFTFSKDKPDPSPESEWRLQAGIGFVLSRLGIPDASHGCHLVPAGGDCPFAGRTGHARLGLNPFFADIEIGVDAVNAFEWNVGREIVTIPGIGLALRWYSLLFAGGLVIAYFVLKGMFKKEGKDLVILEAFPTYVVIGTMVGARLGHCLLYEPGVYLSDPIRILKVWEGGLASHGGFLGVMIAILLFTRKYNQISFFWLVDRCAPCGMICAACIRLGNFFNSEIVGLKTSVPWGVVFKRLGEDFARHPTQLYEAFGYAWVAAIGLGLYKIWDGKVAEGRLFGFMMILGFGYRMLMETFKKNQVAFEDSLALNMGQLLSIPFILVGVYFALLLHHNSQFFQKGLSDNPIPK